MSQLQARPTYYKGTLMRSRLEAGFAQWWDAQLGEGTWTYEGRAYAGSTGQWLPDFVVDLGGQSDLLLIEVKPLGAADLGATWKRMHVARESDPSVSLILAIGSWSSGGYDFALWRCWRGIESCHVCHPNPERAALGARARPRTS